MGLTPYSTATCPQCDEPLRLAGGEIKTDYLCDNDDCPATQYFWRQVQ